MGKYILKRFLLMIPTLLGVAVLIFFLMRVVPGDIVELRFSGESSSVPCCLLASFPVPPSRIPAPPPLVAVKRPGSRK